MENHYFDKSGAYVFSAPANEGTLPPDNALRVPPLREPGRWPVVNAAGDGWDSMPDHRGRRGWLDGRHCVVKRVGPLPDGWSEFPPADKSDSGPRQARQAAYRAEADPIRERAAVHQAEAEAWRIAGDAERAGEAMGKYHAELCRYLARKKSIRARYPDLAADAGGRDGEDGKAPTVVAEPSFYLSQAGTYHREGCSSLGAAGEWLPLSVIRLRHPKAKACRRCRPLGEDTP